MDEQLKVEYKVVAQVQTDQKSLEASLNKLAADNWVLVPNGLPVPGMLLFMRLPKKS